jgi:alpha-ketoglutarate-dependent 2,4-dichlorophenoxyacetate dioxygenase
MAMTLSVKPLHLSFSGEATGVDLRGPLGDATIADVAAAMDRYAVLVFPSQPLTGEQQVAFSERFGDLETPRKAYRSALTSNKVSDVSNLDADNRVLPRGDAQRMYTLGNQLWHTDSSFKLRPATYSMLSAHVVPSSGGETEFADLRAAWDALPEARKTEIEGLVAAHSLAHSRSLIGFTLPPEEQARLPAAPAQRAIVQTHPGSRRKTLFLASHASHIVGWPVPEGRMLLMQLMEFATQREFVYRHRWRVGDLVVWDNRCTMHRGCPFPADQPRDMRRTTVLEAETADRRVA